MTDIGPITKERLYHDLRPIQDEAEGMDKLRLCHPFQWDRLDCVEQIYAAYFEGRLLGVLTIAPNGEMGSGQPTFVGYWVAPDVRQTLIGPELIAAGLDWLRQQGISQAPRFDVAWPDEQALIDLLPADTRAKLAIHSR